MYPYVSDHNEFFQQNEKLDGEQFKSSNISKNYLINVTTSLGSVDFSL